jgi:hypothetical protein
MTNEKKPGFLDGLLAGLAEDHSSEEPSEGVLLALRYIDQLKLTNQEKADLAGTLLADSFKSSIVSALTDKPPTQ